MHAKYRGLIGCCDAVARQERMVRERVARDAGLGGSEEDDAGRAAGDLPAGWGRKKAAWYKEGDSEVCLVFCLVHQD